MTGIGGIIEWDGSDASETDLRHMADVCRYRGPDGLGFHLARHVGLFHLTQALAPEALDDRPPLRHPYQPYWITGDVRVDNRRELLPTLASAGSLDRNATDSELVLAAYEQWGDDAPAHIVGDFAFAIWDGARQRLFAARDPFGTRTLYYQSTPDRTVFATEAKQLLAAGVPARIFEPAVTAHLAAKPGLPDWSFYAGISQLAPAHALSVDSQGSRTWRYWDIDPGHELVYSHYSDYAEHLLELFITAVRCRLRTVKPVGMYLSGGLDSASMAASVAWLLRDTQLTLPSTPRTYCFDYSPAPEADERAISDSLIRHLSWPVTYVPAADCWPLKGGLDHAPDQDEPLIGPYHVLHECTLQSAAQDRIGLLLSAGAGDHMIGGDIFVFRDQLRSGALRELWANLRASSDQTGVRASSIAYRFLAKPLVVDLWQHRLAGPLRPQLRRAARSLGHSLVYPAWIKADFADRNELNHITRMRAAPPRPNSIAQRDRYEFIFSYHVPRIVTSMERLYARAGIAYADPWRDRRIASFVLAVPQDVIRRPGTYKPLLAEAMEGVIPEDVRRTARKIVPTPFFRWAMRGPARPIIRELMTDSQVVARGYVDERAWQDHYESILKGEEPRIDFYNALTLEMWLRKYWA